MDLIQINMALTEATETSGQGSGNVAASQPPREGEELGGDDDPRLIAAELPEQSFRLAHPVDLGCVEESHTPRDSGVERRANVVIAVSAAILPPDPIAPLPGADPKRQDLDTRSPQGDLIEVWRGWISFIGRSIPPPASICEVGNRIPHLSWLRMRSPSSPTETFSWPISSMARPVSCR